MILVLTKIENISAYKTTKPFSENDMLLCGDDIDPDFNGILMRTQQKSDQSYEFRNVLAIFAP
jgi:hypothetical protein